MYKKFYRKRPTIYTRFHQNPYNPQKKNNQKYFRYREIYLKNDLFLSNQTVQIRPCR